MKPDIIEKIEAEFDTPDEVIAQLQSLDGTDLRPVSDRIYRSIVHLARGDRERLGHFMELALKDYRDLLWQAEHEDPEVRKYDFTKSFGEQGL